MRVAVFPAAMGLWVLGGGRWIAGVLPPCRFHEWSGWWCPGCGGTRALEALARGDVLAALRMNLPGTAFMVLSGLWLWRVSWEAAAPGCGRVRVPLGDRTVWGLVTGILAYAVLRNLPWWPFTLLAPV